MEYFVQTISLTYSKVEDRLELICKCGTENHQLWMSQRLWKQATSALIKWLVDTGVGTPNTGDFLRGSFPEQDPLSRPADTLKHLPEDYDALQSSGPQESETKAPVLVPITWLCTTINFSMSGQQVRLNLESERSDKRYVFSMSVLETGHFLIAQRKALQHSGWPFEWPSWLADEAHEELDQDIRFLH